MSHWWTDLVKFLKLLLVLFGLIFSIFIINQFLNLYQFLAHIHPLLGLSIVGCLALGICYYGIRLWLYWRAYPATLELAPDADEPTYQAYLQDLRTSLKRNSQLTSLTFTDEVDTLEAEVTAAITQLDQIALPLIKQNANAIFLTTAISQNGALDSLMVLYSLIRLVWQLTRIYQTRPTLKGVMKLYLQIAGVVLMARGLEDADLIEGQLEPLITSILGESLASAVPGMVPITNLVVSSLMEGAVNAFLTLRVGIVAQAYLGMQTRQNQQSLRRSISLQSVGYMGSILKDNSKIVIKAVANAVKNTSRDTAKRWLKF